MPDKINFAIIGCGRISGKHIGSIKELPNARLMAVCDVKPDRLESKSAEAGCPGYADYRQMLEKHPEIDVVSVITESGLHAPIAIECAHAGKHVLVEKPMALTLDDADQMIETFAEKGNHLFVVKQNRYNPPVLKLREALECGRFGKLVMGTVRVRWKRDQQYYDQDAWRGTWAMDGGVFANQASHHIDLLQWCMGDVDSVFSYSATRLVNIEVEDLGVAALKFANGALGVVEATTAARPVDMEGSLSILGEHGSVVIGGFAVNKMQHWMFDDMKPEDENVMEESSVTPKNVYGFGHVMVYKDIIARLITGKMGGALVDGLHGRKSLELIMAIYESAATGAEVNLKFHPRAAKLGSVGTA